MTLEQRLFETLQREDDFVLALATTDKNGAPHVRFMRGVIDEDWTIRCPTFLATGKVKQIQDRDDVSLTCGDTDSRRPGSYFQITAKATISQETRDREVAWTPRLEKWFRGSNDAQYAVIRMVPLCIRALPIGGGPAAEVWIARNDQPQGS